MSVFPRYGGCLFLYFYWNIEKAIKQKPPCSSEVDARDFIRRNLVFGMPDTLARVLLLKILEGDWGRVFLDAEVAFWSRYPCITVMRYLLMINTGEHWLWLMVLEIWCLAGSFVPESWWSRTLWWKGILQQGGSPHDNRKQRGADRKEAGQVVLLNGILPPTLFPQPGSTF